MARTLRRFFELRPSGRGGRGFSGEPRASGGHRLFPSPVFFVALCLAGAPARSPAREWALHPATAVCEVAAAPAERVVAGCASSAASVRRHGTSLPRWQGAEIWRASTGARDMALVRAPARLAGKRKMEPTDGQTSLRRRETRASSTARAFAGAAAPRGTRGSIPAGAHPAAVSRATRKTGMARIEAASGRGASRGFHRQAWRGADNAAPTRSRSARGGACAIRRGSRRDGA